MSRFCPPSKRAGRPGMKNPNFSRRVRVDWPYGRIAPLPAWLDARSEHEKFEKRAQKLWVQSCREDGVKLPSLLLSAKLEQVGIWDYETIELGWYVEWEEFKLLWERYLDIGRVKIFNRRVVLAPDSFRETGEIPDATPLLDSLLEDFVG